MFTESRKYLLSLIAAEVSALSRYFDRIHYVPGTSEDDGLLMDQIDCPQKQSVISVDALPELSGDESSRELVVLNGCLNHSFDIQADLIRVHRSLKRGSRVITVLYNPYMRWVFSLASILGGVRGRLPSTFITQAGLANLANLSGFEIIRIRNAAYFPFRLLGLGTLINRLMPAIPLLRWLGLSTLAVLRPVTPAIQHRPSLSVIIPARNEAGNLEHCLKTLSSLEDVDVEVIFVEGHSKDNTWDEIQRLSQEPQWSRYQIQGFQQTGKGKKDAVELGFSHASKDLFTILDADATMPPRLLHRFYEAYCENRADFINGSRLVYPMEDAAMRFLNHLGNIFFAKALKWVPGAPISDSLCGTKLLSRHDYQRILAWKRDFGDFDPLGDFQLLFPAAQLGMGTVDIPIRYEARMYGETNISRFRHGLMLLKMTSIGFWKIRMGAGD